MKIAILGASGSVGLRVVHHLLSLGESNTIMLLNRRNLDAFDSYPNVQQHVVDMSTAEAFEKDVRPLLAGVDSSVITMGVGAPSKSNEETLRYVDYELPSVFGKVAKEEGVKRLSVLTAVGADATSKKSWLTGTGAGGGLYCQVKGMIEETLKDLKFNDFATFRPSTLIGSGNTPGIMNPVHNVIDCILPSRFKSIHIDDLGLAMAYHATREFQEETCQTNEYEGSTLFDLVALAKKSMPKSSAPES